MRYATALDFRQALEGRLRARSEAAAVPLLWLRKQVAFDRLLARLVAVGRGRWMLKGALALDYRLGDRARTSKDMDLAHLEGEPQAAADLRRAATLDLGDFFSFEVARTSRLDEALVGAAVRYHLDCRLGRSMFDASTVDVGFSDGPDVGTDLLVGPPLLEFAGIAPVSVPALPLPDHVAQKFHAWVKSYGGGLPSTRSKDLADLVIAAQSFELDAAHLRRALLRTFERRGGPVLPAALPPLPDAWRTDYHRVAARLGVDPDVERAHGIAASFLGPVLGSAEPAGRWIPADMAWEPGRR